MRYRMILLVGLCVAGCRDNPPGAANESPGASGPGKVMPPVRVAKAELRGTSSDGQPIVGTVTLIQNLGQVKISTSVSGLKPGKHGIHIHEKGVCEAPGFESAGDHFNPAGRRHGSPHQRESHAGDLGNLVARDDRTAVHETSIEGITLGGGQASVLDRAVVIHAEADDFRSQPSGASGKRVACGVIRASD